MHPSQPLDLAVVVPTFKERKNVEPLLDLLRQALFGVEYEVIFVDDDSPDGTAEAIRAIARTNTRVRVLQRIGRRGLSSACLEGMLSTPAPYIAVMDADLQHDERILPVMLEKLKSGNLDLVIATRNSGDGSMGGFSLGRIKLSHLGRRLSHLVSKTDLSDPMSGFFVVSRTFLNEVVHASSGVGFKILLDLVSSAERPVRFTEVPYTFRRRIHGDSKLDLLVGIEYLQLLLDKTIGDWIPPRFVLFAMVGSFGYLLFTITLGLLISVLQYPFVSAQVLATAVAMTANFFLNNLLTYRDRRLRGTQLLTGFLTFAIACSAGVVANVRVADFLRQQSFGWYPAGLIGLIVGSVWNYGVTSIITWRRVRTRSRSH
ncbi:MAG: glycosyltransferase family 2 protein [Bryobacteraceae bacterium]